MMETRKIIQILNSDKGILGLADDGSVWLDRGGFWSRYSKADLGVDYRIRESILNWDYKSTVQELRDMFICYRDQNKPSFDKLVKNLLAGKEVHADGELDYSTNDYPYYFTDHGGYKLVLPTLEILNPHEARQVLPYGDEKGSCFCE